MTNCDCKPEMHSGMTHEQHMDLFAYHQAVNIAQMALDAYRNGRYLYVHPLIRRFAEEQTTRLQAKSSAMRQGLWPESETYDSRFDVLNQCEHAIWQELQQLAGERETWRMVALIGETHFHREPQQLSLEMAVA